MNGFFFTPKRISKNIKKMVMDMLVATEAFVIVLMRFIGLKAAVVKHNAVGERRAGQRA